MCDHKEFILCSCNGENLPQDQIGWTLERRDANRPLQMIMGMPAMVFFNSQEENTKNIILNLLNSKNCFDFEYKPKEDDFLQIRTGNGQFKWFSYRFVEGKWTNDNSTSFDTWRTQLFKFEKGKTSIDVQTLSEKIPHTATSISKKDNLFELQQKMMAQMMENIKNQEEKKETQDELSQNPRLNEIKEKLIAAKELWDLGVLTKEEFEEMKKKLLKLITEE